MSFKTLITEAGKGLGVDQLEKLYHNISNPYDDMPKKIGGIVYSKLDDVNVEPGTMFYAINVNGRRVTYKIKTGLRAKEVMIAGKNYIVTNSLSYPAKKYIKEIMIARAPKA